MLKEIETAVQEICPSPYFQALWRNFHSQSFLVSFFAVRLGLASPEFVAPGFFTLGVAVTVIILYIYKQIKKTNRAKKEQDESANEEEI